MAQNAYVGVSTQGKFTAVADTAGLSLIAFLFGFNCLASILIHDSEGGQPFAG